MARRRIRARDVRYEIIGLMGGAISLGVGLMSLSMVGGLSAFVLFKFGEGVNGTVDMTKYNLLDTNWGIIGTVATFAGLLLIVTSAASMIKKIWRSFVGR